MVTRWGMWFVAAFGSAMLALPAAAETKGTAWSYTGPSGVQDWANLSPEYAACGTGQHQSPIDVGTADGPGIRPVVKIDYKPLPLTILHTGHTVEVVVDNGSTLTVDGKEYELLQFHFHTPSEHRVDGKVFDMEIHFVHRAADGGLAIVAVLYEAGGDNDALEPVVTHTPFAKSAPQTFPDITIDPGRILPPLTEFWAYEGSLTTPPCTEGALWMVEKAPAAIARIHISDLTAAMGENSRPIQPIGDRDVVAPRQ